MPCGGAIGLLLPFIAAPMLAITGITSAVHAPEASVTGIELAMIHAPGDADEVPADGGNAIRSVTAMIWPRRYER